MTLKFLLDEDLSFRVAEGLRLRGVDAVSVHEPGHASRGASDEEQLNASTAEGRVLVTHNRADFQALDAEWRLLGRTHAGIQWCSERSIPRRAIGDLIGALETVASRYESLQGICMPLPRPPG